MTDAARPKRFYKTATATAEGSAWTVALDGRPVKTPARKPLAVPSEALGEALAAEWDGQGETLDIAAMHLTRLANVAIDRTPHTRDDLAAEVARFAETDLVSHLAEGPSDLRERQEAAWAPVRRWAGQALGVVLLPVEGILPTPQPPTSLDAARGHAASLDDFRLTGLVFACGLFGSAVLALAVEQGEVPAPEAFDHATLDETWQAEQWGTDDEAAAARAARFLEAYAVGAWFEALG